MASVHKRSWTGPDGKPKAAWRLCWTDPNGTRRKRTFKTKGEADRERVRIEGRLAAGIIDGDGKPGTVLDAANAWLADFEQLCRAGKREDDTLRAYRIHVRRHLEPYAIARVRLDRLAGPDCRAYADALEAALSPAMARKVFTSLRQLLKFAIERGALATNPALSVSIRTAGTRGDDPDERVSIPTKAELAALLQAAADRIDLDDDKGRSLAMVRVLLFAGLRASELRGLPLVGGCQLKGRDGAAIKVRQRADRWNRIGRPKSRAAYRTVPIGPETAAAIQAWAPHVPPGEMGLLFPTGDGTAESYANIWNRIWRPLCRDAGLTDPAPTADNPAAWSPRYGLHHLRHAAISLWIENGRNAKTVQKWAGHSSIKVTYDLYGHLFPDNARDGSAAADIERQLG